MSEQPYNEPNLGESSAKPVTNGPLLAVLVLVLLIILGGLYYWFATLEGTQAPTPTVTRPPVEQNFEPETPTATAQTEVLEVMSTSDEIEAIEADIEATNLDSLDAELQAIDAELEAALQAI